MQSNASTSLHSTIFQEPPKWSSELNKTIVDLEKQNLMDSKEVLDVSIERYKVGKANLLETIETQKNLEDAQVRYIEALYAIKLAETDLLRVNGSLVK